MKKKTTFDTGDVRSKSSNLTDYTNMSPEERGTYNTPINTSIQNDKPNPAVKDCIRLIAENFTAKNQRDVKNQKIIDLIEAGYEIRQPLGPKKINTKKLMQVFWKMLIQSKLLDFEIHGSQKEEWEEDVMTASFSTILHKGNYHGSFRDKGGVAPNMFLFGDGFRLIGPRRQSGFPIEFTPISNTNLYVNTQATGFRNGNKRVSKAAVVFSGTWDQFISYFPEAKNIAGMGRVPREVSYYKETEATYLQRIKQDKKITEWCYYFDIEHRVYCLFAGAACTILELKVGKEYPYVYTDEEGREVPYIPVSDYSCIPATQGFYNHGVGELIYDLVLLYAGIFNQLSQNIEDNVNPIDFVNLPQGEEDKFFEKIQMAYQERALGRRAFVPIGTGNGANNQVTLQPFTTQAQIGEAIQLFDRIDLELKRIGIFLDELDLSTTPTEMEILSHLETKNEFMRQIMEFNSSEAEFELNVTKDFIKKFVKSNDKTPINLTTRIKNPKTGELVRFDDLTLGLVKKELVNNNWFIRMNDRSGFVPSNTQKRAENMQLLPLMPAGSKGQMERIKEIGRLNNIDVSDEDLQPPQPQGVPQGGSPDLTQPNLNRAGMDAAAMARGELVNKNVPQLV